MVGRWSVLTEFGGVDAHGSQRRVILGLGDAHNGAPAEPALPVKIVIRRERHLDVERIACPRHVFRTIRWHPTNQDAGAADGFYALHRSARSFATRSDAALERQIPP